MTRPKHHPLEHAVQSAANWLADVRAEFGTDDDEFVYRVTKAWLHAVRDRLPVLESVHFAAQLPDLLRGVYYEGWQPSAVPTKCDVDEFVRNFAEAARVTPSEVPKVLWAVSDALNRRMTNIDKMVDLIPADIRALLRP